MALFLQIIGHIFFANSLEKSTITIKTVGIIRNTIETIPIDTELALSSSALVFDLIIAEVCETSIANSLIMASTLSSTVRFEGCEKHKQELMYKIIGLFVDGTFGAVIVVYVAVREVVLDVEVLKDMAAVGSTVNIVDKVGVEEATVVVGAKVVDVAEVVVFVDEAAASEVVIVNDRLVVDGAIVVVNVPNEVVVV